MTTLSIYPTTLASTTLPMSNQLLANVTGASNTSRLTKVGTSTGYGECASQGTANAWAAASSLPAQTGKGWLLDSTLLEGQQIAAGIWTPSVRFTLSIGTMTADILVRYAVYHSGGVYTTIGTITLTAQSFTTTTTEYTLPATALGSITFGTGDKLYYDIFLNITTNGTGSSGATINASMASSSTQGSTQIVTATPGYATNPTAWTAADGTTLNETAGVTLATTVQDSQALGEVAAFAQAPQDSDLLSMMELATLTPQWSSVDPLAGADGLATTFTTTAGDALTLVEQKVIVAVALWLIAATTISGPGNPFIVAGSSVSTLVTGPSGGTTIKGA